MMAFARSKASSNADSRPGTTSRRACSRTMAATYAAADQTRSEVKALLLKRKAALERLGAVGELYAGKRRDMRMQILELQRHRADAVGAGQRDELDRAQDPEGLAAA